MVDVIDSRPLNATERQEMIDVTINTPELDFKKNYVWVKEKEYSIKREPFCSRCAIADFRKVIKDTIGEYQISNTEQALDIGRQKINFDLEKYGKEKRFKLINVKPIGKKDKISDEQVLGGYETNYVCIERGCGHSISLTIGEYEQKVKDKKLPKVESPWLPPIAYRA
jgi:hypothetical protein